jgi:hypothetical protein
MSFGQDFNPFMPSFAAKREIRVRETELIHTLGHLKCLPSLALHLQGNLCEKEYGKSGAIPLDL